MQKLKGLEPESVFSYFEEICAIPHGSGNTKAISDYLVEFAKAQGLSYKQDALNNVLMFAEGTNGLETHETIILQGHMDMVCEKEPSCSIDMDKECIDVTHDDHFVFAKGTTLGGDDGIAVAMMLAILSDKSLTHPPIEAIFTVDEETGMEGANGIDLSMLQGKRLLNLDSEDEGVFTVSCAGGVKSTIQLPVTTEKVEGTLFRIFVDGCIGGHSGVEIHKNRVNANKMLSGFLDKVLSVSALQICTLEGGAKDNAIPRNAEVTCFLEAEKADLLNDMATKWTNKVRKQYDDPNATLSVEILGETEKEAVTVADSKKIVALLEAVPNGIQSFSQEIKGLVQTSLNLGIVHLKNQVLSLTFAIRSSVNPEKDGLRNTLQFISQEFHANYSERGAYPAWEYQKNSPLRDACVKAFEKIYHKEPTIEAIHAGLECGLFSEKIPHLDCLSLGPQLHDVHTSRERLDIASTTRTWDLLLDILKLL